MIEAGMRGYAPQVLVQPIERTPMTVGDLLKFLEGVPPSTWVHIVAVSMDGPLDKVHKELGANEPFVTLFHIGK